MAVLLFHKMLLNPLVFDLRVGTSSSASVFSAGGAFGYGATSSSSSNGSSSSGSGSIPAPASLIGASSLVSAEQPLVISVSSSNSASSQLNGSPAADNGGARTATI